MPTEFIITTEEFERGIEECSRIDKENKARIGKWPLPEPSLKTYKYTLTSDLIRRRLENIEEE